MSTSLNSQALPGDLERTQGTGGDLAETEPRHWATMTGYPQGAGLAAHTGNTGVETRRPRSWTQGPKGHGGGKSGQLVPPGSEWPSIVMESVTTSKSEAEEVGCPQIEM